MDGDWAGTAVARRDFCGHRQAPPLLPPRPSALFSFISSWSFSVSSSALRHLVSSYLLCFLFHGDGRLLLPVRSCEVVAPQVHPRRPRILRIVAAPAYCPLPLPIPIPICLKMPRYPPSSCDDIPATAATILLLVSSHHRMKADAPLNHRRHRHHQRRLPLPRFLLLRTSSSGGGRRRLGECPEDEVAFQEAERGEPSRPPRHPPALPHRSMCIRGSVSSIATTTSSGGGGEGGAVLARRETVVAAAAGEGAGRP